MAIPVRSKQLRSLIDQNQSQTENIIQQLRISEVLYKKKKKETNQKTKSNQPQTIIVCVFPVMNMKICSARSTVWFGLLFCECVCSLWIKTELL